jgi:hypothetical protein
MKSFIGVIQGLLILLVFVVVFLMLLYHGSGHQIPLKTDIIYSSVIVILIILYIILIPIKRRIVKQR